MPLKAIKKNTANELTLEWVMHVKNYKLTLDKNFCVSCQICNLACPKEAITINKKLIDNEKNGKNCIDIDLEKCNFCGICDIICPFGAIKLSKNGENSISVIEKNSFPQLIRKIEINSLCCPKECDDCKDACPLSLI
ncbi:4Fe-4S binding protein, partial [Candidatus Bathyarchaeota archaeon]|nr:4Fe-4S binding protein [Candidatus Bathyarchaeota archaeon]